MAIGSITIGDIIVARNRVGIDAKIHGGENIIIHFPKQISEDDMWKLGRFAVDICDQAKKGRMIQ